MSIEVELEKVKQDLIASVHVQNAINTILVSSLAPDLAQRSAQTFAAVVTKLPAHCVAARELAESFHRDLVEHGKRASG